MRGRASVRPVSARRNSAPGATAPPRELWVVSVLTDIPWPSDRQVVPKRIDKCVQFSLTTPLEAHSGKSDDSLVSRQSFGLTHINRPSRERDGRGAARRHRGDPCLAELRPVIAAAASAP